MSLALVLMKHGACEEALDWAEGRDYVAAWSECERADWMLWIAAKALPRDRVVLTACACARTALKYVPEGEDRPRIAIETAERWARGEATIEEVRSADAADAAADAAHADAASRVAALREMADIVRRLITADEVLAGLKGKKR
jgi:hypothetical protein